MPQPWPAANGRGKVAIAPAPKPVKRAASNDGLGNSIETSSARAAAAPEANTFKPDAVTTNSRMQPVVEVGKLSVSTSTR